MATIAAGAVPATTAAPRVPLRGGTATCPACGFANVPGRVECLRCHAGLVRERPASPAEVAPPRAVPWRKRLGNAAPALVRRLVPGLRRFGRALAFGLPHQPLLRVWVTAPVPGLPLYLVGAVRVAACVASAWLAAVLVFAVALGTPIRWWASVAAIVIHVAGAVVAGGAELRLMTPGRRALHAAGLALVLNVGLYGPVTRWSEARWTAIELRAPIADAPLRKGDVVSVRADPDLPGVGEIVAVRIANGAYGNDVVMVDRVIGVPGDRIDVTSRGIRRNGVLLTRDQAPLVSVPFRGDVVLLVPEGRFCAIPTTAYTAGYLKSLGTGAMARIAVHPPSAYLGRCRQITWPWARRGPIEPTLEGR